MWKLYQISRAMTTWGTIRSYIRLRKRALSSVVLEASVNRGSITSVIPVIFFFIFTVSERVPFQFTSCHLILMSTSVLSFSLQHSFIAYHILWFISCCTTEATTQFQYMNWHNKLILSMYKETGNHTEKS